MRSTIYTAILLTLLMAACSSPKVELIVIDEISEPTDQFEDNPFFTQSKLPFEAPDFDQIDEEHFLPAFREGMRMQLQEVEAILANPAEPTFRNTILELEKSGVMLDRVQRVFFNLASAHTNEKIQEIQAEIAPRLAAHSDNIYLNRQLFEQVNTVYERRNRFNLDAESLRLLEETRRNFIRAGAELSDEQQERMRQINERISSLTTEFQEKLLAMTQERSVHVADRSDLRGLSEGRIEAARQRAEERGYDEGYLLTITNTTRQPLLASLENRQVRQRLWEASAYRGIGLDGGIDTRPIALELVELRAERAELLGYSDWATYTIEPQTAGTPERVVEMIDDLVPQVRANTEREADLIRELMREDGIEEDLRAWDWEYYAERVRQSRYEVDEEEVRPYFELERVLQDGVFYTMERLYGITFEERDDLPVYHPDVRVFTVHDEDGSRLGLFYADYFERDSKRGGAWMNSFVVQSRLMNQKPVVVNVLNIPPPAEGDAALISFSNVTTLFHEMGHAVHGLFSNVNYPSLSGTSVPRDFVEFPSTFEEDWAIHPEVISNYAKHYETGEPIPRELLERLIEARQFNQGFDTQEYLAATVIDMEWHRLSSDEIPEDLSDFEQRALESNNLYDDRVPPRYKSPYFAHIFAGGYSANYYSYIWSEVLAADAFAFMRERGGLIRENGDHYRQTILSRGGTRDAMELYLDFRGQEPDVRHLLVRRGLDVEPEESGGDDAADSVSED